MKNLIFLIVALCCTLQAEAQDNATQQFYKKYKALETATVGDHRYWAKKLLPGFYSRSWMEELEESGALEILVLRPDQVDVNDLQELKNKVGEAQFDLLVQAKTPEEQLDFYTKTDGSWISNLLFLLKDNEEEEFVFLSLQGKWTINDILDRSRSID